MNSKETLGDYKCSSTQKERNRMFEYPVNQNKMPSRNDLLLKFMYRECKDREHYINVALMKYEAIVVVKHINCMV